MDLNDQEFQEKFEERESHFNQPTIQLLEYAFYRGMMTAAAVLCPACKEAIPLKFLPKTEMLIHLDLFATKEAGRGYNCAAEKIILAMISGQDERQNPDFSREKIQELMELLVETDDER